MQSPKIPSATSVAGAQTKSNIDTATAQQELNMVNQVTPTGSLTYTQNGTNPDGTPKYTATTALSGAQQGLLTGGQSAEKSLLDKINAGQSTDYKTLSQQTQDQLDGLASQRLDPSLDRQLQSLRQQLANSGIKPGTEAYNNAMTLNSQSANDARNSLILGGYTTANQAAMNETNLPYNQLASLMGNTQNTTGVGTTGTPSAGIQGTDIAGLTNQQYQAQLAQSNANNNALGSIGSTIGGWFFSDPKLKTDVHKTGMKTKDGIPLKTFRYKGSPMMNMGVMADDAQKKRPDAVRTTPSGFKAVNYDKIGSPMLRLGAR